MKEFTIPIGQIVILTYEKIVVKKGLWADMPERMWGVFNEEPCEFVKDHSNPDICRLLVQKESDNKPDVKLVFTRQSPDRNYDDGTVDHRSDESYRSNLFGGSLISIVNGNIKSLFMIDQVEIQRTW